MIVFHFLNIKVLAKFNRMFLAKINQILQFKLFFLNFFVEKLRIFSRGKKKKKKKTKKQQQ